MTDLPDVKLRALTNFPVTVDGRTGINVVKIAGRWYIDLDVSGFVQNASIPVDQVEGKWVTIWDEATDSYQNVPYALVATAGVASIDGQTGALDIGNGLVFTGATLDVEASTIPFVPLGTGAQTGDLRTRGRFSVYVMDFIPKALWAGIEAGTEATDLYAYETLARNYIAGQAISRRLIYPSGRYYRSEAPNWAIQDAEIVGEGEVRIRYTGTGNAVLLDGISVSAGGVFNTRIKNFIVEAPATASNGFAAFAAHKALFEKCKVLGCGPGSAGFYSEWCVGATWDNPIVSFNEENAWYDGAQPGFGMYLTRNGSGTNTTSFCDIRNAYMEGVPTGVFCDYAGGNNFVGGALEGCSASGLSATANSEGNKFYGIDFEANPVRDIILAGTADVIEECSTATFISFQNTATRCKVVGGQHEIIFVNPSAGNCQVLDLTYNRGGAGTFSDASGSTYYRNVIDRATSLPYRVNTRNITITTSPQDISPVRNLEMVVVVGGTVSNISLVRNSTVNNLFVTSGTFVIGAGDVLRITSSAAPSVISFPYTA